MVNKMSSVEASIIPDQLPLDEIDRAIMEEYLAGFSNVDAAISNIEKEIVQLEQLMQSLKERQEFRFKLIGSRETYAKLLTDRQKSFPDKYGIDDITQFDLDTSDFVLKRRPQEQE